MSKNKTKHSAAFKTKVAVAAIKQDLTQSQITTEYGVHSTQINQWKKLAIDAINSGFSCRSDKANKENEQLVDELYRQVGKLKVELDWLKKKS